MQGATDLYDATYLPALRLPATQVYNITLYDTPGQAVLDCPTYDHVSSRLGYFFTLT